MSVIEIINAEQFKQNRNIDAGNPEQLAAVGAILSAVRSDGDIAVRKFTEQFDGIKLDELRVSRAELASASEGLDAQMLKIIRTARDNITNYHERQKQQSWFTTDQEGTVLGQKVSPLDRVGVYVPGGTAAYPSSVMMNVLPAKIAGVQEIVMCTPPGKNGIPKAILAAAHECGVTEVYQIGGAQAIAAMAYGTKSIKAVDKITGPGNVYVAIAKRLVFGVVDIDMIAGPSEILVACDETADAAYVAADMLSQAEHDEDAAAYAITLSQDKAEQIKSELDKQLKKLTRADIARKSLASNGKIIIANNREQMLELINTIAPEHLEMMVAEPLAWLGGIRHAGAIFLGDYSPEPVGDYFAGPNHVLPTSGTARFSSPLAVDDFIKKSSVIYYSKQAIINNGKEIARFAREEGFDAHARSVELRLQKL